MSEQQVTQDKPKRAWWLSWYHEPRFGQFELHSPWWISGMRMADDADTIVAAVQAESEQEAWEKVKASYDEYPTVIEIRFCNELEDVESQPNARAPWSTPENGRFPQPEWAVWEP